jgi:hypothetical protein
MRLKTLYLYLLNEPHFFYIRYHHLSPKLSENSSVPQKGVNPNEWGSFLSLSQMEDQVPVSLGLLAAGETGDSPAVVHEILQAHLAVRVVTRQDLQQVNI